MVHHSVFLQGYLKNLIGGETIMERHFAVIGDPIYHSLSGMLLHQGALAWEFWFGRQAPLEIMEKALRRAIYG